MPSTKVTDNCPACGRKNPLRSEYCSHCGHNLSDAGHMSDPADQREEHRDICHPIRSEFRHYIQTQIVNAYLQKVGAAAEQPGRRTY